MMTQAPELTDEALLATLRWWYGLTDYGRIAAHRRAARPADEGLREENERLRAENEDLKLSVMAFGGPAMAEYARDFGLPDGHLHPHHYDILKATGARMDSFTRADEASALSQKGGDQ